MLDVSTKKNGNKYSITLDGRLDTTTASVFESKVQGELSEGMTVEIDMKKLSYVSSAGLRSILMVKQCVGKGAVILYNVSDDIRDVFEITGFSGLLEIR